MDHKRKIHLFIRRFLKILPAIFAVTLAVAVISGIVFVNIFAAYLQKHILPQSNIDLDGYDLDQTSYLYYYNVAGDLEVLQRLYTSTDRRWVSYEEIPEDLINAAIAIEDKRFYEHQGVDWITTAKAALNLLVGRGDTFGGSTLTQQLVKNLYMTTDNTADDVTVRRKVLEIFRAIAFEKVYDKKTVLEWYLNCIYFGDGCNGVKSASQHYFGKELTELSTAECAALIGITNNPTLYNPYRTSLDNYRGEQLTGAERNRRRQESILEQMYVQGWIDQAQYEQAMEQELVFRKGNESSSGEQYVYSWFVDTVLEDVAKAMAQRDGVSAWNDTIRSHYMTLISRGGYHIYTTYDEQAQLAVDSVYEDLTQIPSTQGKQQLQSAIVLIDNSSGDIVAMSGGVGKKQDFDAYNRAEVPLQIGSSIKPLTVYAPAFEKGLISPATVIADLPLKILDNGIPFPRNDSRVYSYSRTVLQGIVSSTNAIAVNTLDRLGLANSFEFATEKFGITTLTKKTETASGQILTDLDYAPLAMGALTNGMTVRQVASAYATFANDGVWRQGRTFLLVLDADGDVVINNRQESRGILSEKTVNYMNYCLDTAVDSGTGAVADISGMDVAGKTGTTSGKKDRYFAGFTGYYTAAVWCGFDTPEQIVLIGDTSNPAARLWKKVMTKLHVGKRRTPLYSTEGMIRVNICLDSGLLATDSCCCDIRSEDGLSRVEQVWIYPEDRPLSYCTRHISVDYCTEGNGVANEYCRRFAEIGALELDRKALLKLTTEQYETLLNAAGKGLSSDYLRNDYVYLVDRYGASQDFHGFDGTVNLELHAPYQLCTVHTRQSWEAYVPPTQPIEPETPPTLFPLPTENKNITQK